MNSSEHYPNSNPNRNPNPLASEVSGLLGGVSGGVGAVGGSGPAQLLSRLLSLTGSGWPCLAASYGSVNNWVQWSSRETAFGTRIPSSSR